MAGRAHLAVAAEGLAPRLHHVRVVDRDAHNVLDPLGPQGVILAYVARDVNLPAAGRERRRRPRHVSPRRPRRRPGPQPRHTLWHVGVKAPGRPISTTFLPALSSRKLMRSDGDANSGTSGTASPTCDARRAWVDRVVAPRQRLSRRLRVCGVCARTGRAPRPRRPRAVHAVHAVHAPSTPSTSCSTRTRSGAVPGGRGARTSSAGTRRARERGRRCARRALCTPHLDHHGV